MKISPIAVQNEQKVNKGKTIGALAGLGASAAYAIKNRQDLFIEGGIKAAEEAGRSKAIGIAIPAILVTGLAAVSTAVGSKIGGAIGKAAANKNNQAENKPKHNIGKAIAGTLIAAGATVAAIAAGYKTGTIDKLAGKLTGKAEVLKPVLANVNKAGEVIYNKAGEIATAASKKLSDVKLNIIKK
ncbi:hypothetical protein IJ182_08415 [bacterium]|nr:hypothetical protein [bacterium]